MSTSVVLDKTDFIKFNVSPTFKKNVAKKAKSMGFTLSELGRMLFGAYVNGMIGHPTLSKGFLKMAQEAERDYKQGETKSFTNTKDMLRYLDSL